MQFLDRTGVGTLWSMCKTKFALAGHTHNSLAAVGNEQISATAYGSGLHFKPYYSSGGPTTYGNILEYTSTNTGGGQLAMEWTGSQTESDGTDSNVGRVYYRSKRDCINGWTKWMTLAYTNDIPTKLSQLTNDKGFVTGSVSGNTVTINGASTTWTNTWRGIQDNLTSTSTSDSLSANQGRILKSLVDSKANSNEVIKSVRVQLYGDTINGFTPNIVVTDNANQEQYFTINKANGGTNGLMSFKDKNKLDLIPDNLSDVCKFNFVNSISECRSDRINFILRYHPAHIDLDPFDSYPDGTILLITTSDGGQTSISHKSGRWYSNGDVMFEDYNIGTYDDEINLITKNNGIVHHYSFN